MGIFPKSQKEGELALVFDIGSSSVGGALFFLNKSGVPKIVTSIREPIVLLGQMDVDQFLSLTLKSFSVVAEKLVRSGVGAPKKIFCVLSSPWYGSQTRLIKLEKNTPFVFNSKLADSLIQKETEFFKEEHLVKNLETGDQVMPIELKNMRTTLNGYPTQSPLGQKVKELEMTIFISMSSGQFLEKIQKIISDHFHRDDAKFSSFAMASFAVIRDMFAEHNNFLLIDVGGEMTSVSLIKQDILRESISFPIGKNFIIRGVASKLRFPLDEAKSLVSLYADNHAEDATKQKLDTIVKDLRSEWLKKFQESLAVLSNDISIPATIFITADPDLADFFCQTIKNEQLNQYTLTESEFKITYFGKEELHGNAILEKNVARDAFLTLEAIYINRFIC